MEKMLNVLVDCIKPNGSLVLIGDTDSGRLHTIGDEAFSPQSMGPHFPALGRALHIDLKKSPKSLLIPEAQIAILQSSDLYCIIDAGDNGQDGNGGHAHNDVVSFELSFQGRDLVIDPGTGWYTYDPGLRNLYRSTAMHSTLMIDKQEQNRIPKASNGLFWLFPDARPNIVSWSTSDDVDRFSAEHRGYHRLRHPVIHRRSFCIDKKRHSLAFTDECIGIGVHDFDWNFIIAPEWSAHIEKQNTVRLDSAGLHSTLRFPLECHAIIRDIAVSPSYGEFVNSVAVSLSYRGECRSFNFAFDFR